MNMRKILRESYGEADHNATIAFRLSEAQKEAFVSMCNEHNISIGRLMRALVREFMEGMQDD